MRRAVSFFRSHVGYRGAYVYRVSSDLKLREGERKAGPKTGWLEPPGTPAVGMAYLESYQLCRDPSLLDAAREVGDALVESQLQSGGWADSFELDADENSRYAYRRLNRSDARRRNISTLDDDKTQSALRFLMRLDLELEHQDSRLSESVQYGLAKLLAAQSNVGAWPQMFDGTSSPATEVPAASYPESWPRKFPNKKYSRFFTLNDNTTSDAIATMLLAYDVYGNEKFFRSAMLGGEFFLKSQMPSPQPAWAQQYDEQLRPMWARKFEPPAVTGGESQGVMKTLCLLYERKRDQRFLDSVNRGIEYLKSSTLPNGKLARFYELETNRPLYFTKDYRLTYSDNDLPTHYGFVVGSSLKSIEKRVRQLSERNQSAPTDVDRRHTVKVTKAKMSSSLQKRVREIVNAIDTRGAWVQKGAMRNFDNPTGKVIESRTFCQQLVTLASYLGALNAETKR